MTQHPDPRARRHHVPSVDALAAAVRLDAATADMRARALAGGPEPLDDEPPTGLIDLAALRAMVGAGDSADVDPAAAAWLAGGADPDAARVVEQIDQLDGEWRETAEKLGEVAPHLVEGFVERAREVTREECHAAGHPEPVVDCPACPQEAPAHSPEPVPVTVAPSAGERAPAPDWQAEHPVAAELLPAVEAVERVVVRAERSLVNGLNLGPKRARLSDHEPRPGWASRHDERSLAFHVRRSLAGSTPVQNVDLPVGPVLDQGQEGECVGCGVVDAVNVLRNLAGRTPLLKIADAAGLYHLAQTLDDVPGTDYTGTSVLAGMKAAQQQGWISGYEWALGTRDIAQSILAHRPVVVGVPWLSGMYDTGPGGLVQVAGEDRGEGHCLLVAKLRMVGPQGQPGPFFGWQNSWGVKYGAGGIGWIHHRDLAGLLHGSGEAAVPSL